MLVWTVIWALLHSFMLQTVVIALEYGQISNHTGVSKRGIIDQIVVSNINSECLLSDIRLGTSKTLDWRGGHYYFFVMTNARDQGVSKEMFEKGQWEANLNLMFKSLWETDGKFSNHMVLDVGANFGSFTMFAASQGCHVTSFEMQPMIFTLLEMSIRISGYKSHVILHNTAVWEKSGEEMSFTVYEGEHNYGGTHVNEGKKGKMSITSSRIDELVPEQPIFFMKMDVEGSEAHALAGMDKFITGKLIKNIVIETTTADLLEVFYKNGYVCRLFDDGTDCSWPNLASSCQFDFYETVKPMFATREKKMRGYFDMHCFLQ